MEHRVARFPGSRERILSHSPSGKVPCLIDHGFTVWDSLAIGEYLAEKNPALLPADPAARAIARAVTAEMHAGFQNLRSRMPMNVRKDYTGFGHSPEVDADIARIIAIWNDCRARFGAGGPFLFGEFSAADAMNAFEDRKDDPTSLPEMARRINPFLVESGLAKEEADLGGLFDSSFTKAYVDASE